MATIGHNAKLQQNPGLVKEHDFRIKVNHQFFESFCLEIRFIEGMWIHFGRWCTEKTEK
jgi:hypothetical protein